MCTVVSADYLLATILSMKETVPFNALRELRSKIQRSSTNLSVDISARSIDAALEYYPEIFKKENEYIARAQDWENYLRSNYLKNEFTSSVPKRVHRIVQKAISASIP